MYGTVARHDKFIGIDVSEDFVNSAREELSKILGDDFTAFEAQKFDRDGQKWHMTVALFKDFKKLSTEQRAVILRGFDYVITGIGEAVSGEDKAWFATVESVELAEAMASVGLPARDFHITLAFSNKDIHGVDKSGYFLSLD